MDGLKAAFGEDVSGELSVEPGIGAANWSTKIIALLPDFKIHGARLAIEDGEATLEGVLSQEDADALIGKIQAALGDVVRLTSNVKIGPAAAGSGPGIDTKTDDKAQPPADSPSPAR